MLEFRHLQKDDWKEFNLLEQEAFEKDAMNETSFSDHLKEDGFIGLFSNKQLIGYLFMRIIESYGHLSRIAVKKSEWGKGYGSKLMSYALEYFTQRNSSNIHLYVESENERAIALYKKFGFSVISESWHYFVAEDQVKLIENNLLSKKIGDIQILKSKDLSLLHENFPDAKKEEFIERLNRIDYYNLGFFVKRELIIYGAFLPSFSGMRPFLCKKPEYLEAFLAKLTPYREKPYLRITFDGNKPLVEHCDKQNYRIWHHLFRMEKK